MIELEFFIIEGWMIPANGSWRWMISKFSFSIFLFVFEISKGFTEIWAIDPPLGNGKDLPVDKKLFSLKFRLDGPIILTWCFNFRSSLAYPSMWLFTPLGLEKSYGDVRAIFIIKNEIYT